MLKSVECKQEMVDLQTQIQDLTNKGEAAPQELLDQFEAKKNEYIAALEKEMEDKKVNQPVITDVTASKALFNKSLKSALLGIKDENFDKFFNTASGQNGAVGADGGYLIPEEFLPLAELNMGGVDLRAIVTNVPVTTRSGKVPIVNYDDQTLGLVDFDENNEITESKATFGSASFNLSSKGAIIPVSRELLLDANSDVLAIISNVFGKVYSHAVNKAITALVETDTTAGKQTTTDLNDAVDKIKTAVITTKTAFGGPTVVIGKKSWAKLALAKDAQKRYLLARDANNSTIKAIEGCAVMVVDDKDISENAVLVGDFSAIYHIAFPSLEIASSEHAGFNKNSVFVRAVCRFTNLDVYKEAFTQITLPTA